MWIVLARIAVGLLLMIHGMAHWNIITAWGARPTAESWLVGGSGTAAALTGLGNGLWVATLAAFLVAGALLGFNVAWWQPLAFTAAVLSLVTIALFWQPNMILGVLVDLAIMAAVLWPNSPVIDTLAR